MGKNIIFERKILNSFFVELFPQWNQHTQLSINKYSPSNFWLKDNLQRFNFFLEEHFKIKTDIIRYCLPANCTASKLFNEKKKCCQNSLTKSNIVQIYMIAVLIFEPTHTRTHTFAYWRYPMSQSLCNEVVASNRQWA